MINIAGEEETRQFGDTEEQVIISLLLEQSEMMLPILPYLEPEHFINENIKKVFIIIKEYFNEYKIILTREMCLDRAKHILTTSDPYKEIFTIINKKLDPREGPIVSDRLIDITRKKIYGELYSVEVSDAYARGEYEKLEKVIERAQRINAFHSTIFYFLDEYKTLFDPDNEKKLKTGFVKLDNIINLGGPIKGDVFCWLGATNTGKSIMLINNGANCIKNNLNVLHITLEMPINKVAERYLGCFTDKSVMSRFEEQNKATMIKRIESVKHNYSGVLMIDMHPPNDITVDVIHSKIDHIRRTRGIAIDVVIVDYLDLLLPRHSNSTDGQYQIQKVVAVDLSRLAKKENVLVFTATQTNRQGSNKNELIEIDKMAESYGKSFSVDYIVSINEAGDVSPTNHRDLKFYIAKNRNGPRQATVEVRVDYNTYIVKEIN